MCVLFRHFRARNSCLRNKKDIVKAVAKFCHIEGRYKISSIFTSRYHIPLVFATCYIHLKDLLSNEISEHDVKEDWVRDVDLRQR